MSIKLGITPHYKIIKKQITINECSKWNRTSIALLKNIKQGL